MTNAAGHDFEPWDDLHLSPEHLRIVATGEDDMRWLALNASPEAQRAYYERLGDVALSEIQAVERPKQEPEGVTELRELAQRIMGDKIQGSTSLAYHFYEDPPETVDPVDARALKAFRTHAAVLLPLCELTQGQYYIADRVLAGEPFVAVLDDMLKRRPELKRARIIEGWRSTLREFKYAERQRRLSGYTRE